MWVVSWLGRQDPDPRTRPQSTLCATFSSARDLARRVSLDEGVRVRVQRVDGEFGGMVTGGERRRVVVDERGMCAHELNAEWCALCRRAR